MNRITVFAKTLAAAGGKELSHVFIEIDQGRIRRISHSGSRPDISADVALPGFIDPHAHCRDWGQSHKETFRTAGEAALNGGITQLHDMPNTDPPVLWREDAERRIADAAKAGIKPSYRIYMGVSADARQLEEAAGFSKACPEVAGLKLYAGESFGDLGVTEPGQQSEVYKTLAGLRYRGVLMVHCEKASLFANDRWTAERPETWSEARPPQAETEAVRDQLRFALNAGFQGRLQICHATLPEAVSLISNAPGTLKAGCGATPHHLILDSEMMAGRAGGLLLKINPPLRGPDDAAGLRSLLTSGRISWLETDHAPHLLHEKLNPPYCSGVPELDTFAGFVCHLNRELGIPWDRIASLTSLNAARAFGLGSRAIEPGNEANMTLLELSPQAVERGRLKTACGWSPYEGMAFPGRCCGTVIAGEAFAAADR